MRLVVLALLVALAAASLDTVSVQVITQLHCCACGGKGGAQPRPLVLLTLLCFSAAHASRSACALPHHSRHQTGNMGLRFQRLSIPANGTGVAFSRLRRPAISQGVHRGTPSVARQLQPRPADQRGRRAGAQWVLTGKRVGKQILTDDDQTAARHGTLAA